VLEEGMEGVRAFLGGVRLGEYAEAFEEQGYDDLPWLSRLGDDLLREICDSLGMKPGHAMKFVMKLREPTL
jgi:hypothetical protein